LFCHPVKILRASKILYGIQGKTAGSLYIVLSVFNGFAANPWIPDIFSVRYRSQEKIPE